MVTTFNELHCLSIKYKLFRICPQVKLEIIAYADSELPTCFTGCFCQVWNSYCRIQKMSFYYAFLVWQSHCECWPLEGDNAFNAIVTITILKKTIVLIITFNDPRICTHGTLDVVIFFKGLIVNLNLFVLWFNMRFFLMLI